MAAFDFPNTPAIGDTANGYVWDGQKWAGGGTSGITQTDADARYVNVAGDTMTGMLALSADPTLPVQAATKKYVDDHDTNLATNAMVRFDTPQALTEPQRVQARQNIYAAPFDALAYNGLQINGGFNVSQELGIAGVSTPGKYVVDGWVANWSGAGVMAALPAAAGSLGGTHVLLMQATTGFGAAGANGLAAFHHYIEGLRWARMQYGYGTAQPVTIAFMTYATKAGTASISIANGANNRGYTTNFTINAANTWEYKTVTIPGDIAGTWALDASKAVVITFCFMCGTAYQVAPNAWGGAVGYGTAATTNFFTTTGDTAYLANLVILPGIEAPSQARLPNIIRPFEQELLLCQRYYYKSFDYGSAPIPNNGYNGSLLVSTNASSTFGGTFFFPVAMRAAGTAITYCPVANSANWYDVNNSAERTVGGITVGQKSVCINGSGGIVHGLNRIQVSVDARL